VNGQHEPALGFPGGGGKLGPGRDAAKRWEPPGKGLGVKQPGGEARAATALSPTLEQEPASGTLSPKLAGAGSWDIRCDKRLFPNDLSCLHGLQILPLVL
jgi:hypothetical protein